MLSSRFLLVNMNLRCESIFDSVIYLGDLKECDGTHSERSARKEDYQQDVEKLVVDFFYLIVLLKLYLFKC